MVHSIEATRVQEEMLLYTSTPDVVQFEYPDYINQDTNVCTIFDINNPRLKPPYTDDGVDANFYGGLTERSSVIGGYVSMSGTMVMGLIKKNLGMTHNSTDAEINAAFYMGKVIL